VKILLKTSANSVILLAAALFSPISLATSELIFEAGHPSLQNWLLPDKAPEPKQNSWTSARSELGKMLFFDPRLSRNGTISCATCHNPMLGWSDGLKTGVGINGSRLGRASPAVTNTAHNFIQMWDGRKKDLEDQATGPMDTAAEMHTDFEATLSFLANSQGYASAFEKAYPGKGITRDTIAKAIASFERTIISNDSPFDRWVQGDNNALNQQQVAGFKLFVDPKKGNCEVCHSAPNFVDDGFHNIGLKGDDLGRYNQRKVKILKHAFKTPTLRDVELSAPYFHDGSAKTLEDVIEHYDRGGENSSGLDPNMSPLKLSQQEKSELIAFMSALTTEPKAFVLPILPLR